MNSDLSTISVCTGEVSAILGGVLEAAIALAEADFGNIQLLDPDGHLRIVAHRGFPDWWVDYWNTVSMEQRACDSSLALGDRVIVEDVELSPIFVGSPALDIQLKAGIRAVQSTPLRGQSGQVLGMFSTYHRIPHRPGEKTQKALDLLAAHTATLIERAQSDAALRASEERLRRVSDNIDVGLARFDRNFIYQSANPAYCKLVGMPVDDVVGQPLAAIVGEATFKKIRPNIERALNGETVSFENKLAYLGERVRYVHVTNSPDTDPDGQIVGWVACVTDISDRKRAEEELLKSEVRYRSYFQSNPTRCGSMTSRH